MGWQGSYGPLSRTEGRYKSLRGNPRRRCEYVVQYGPYKIKLNRLYDGGKAVNHTHEIEKLAFVKIIAQVRVAIFTIGF